MSTFMTTKMVFFLQVEGKSPQIGNNTVFSCSSKSMDLSDEAAMKARETTEMNSSGECSKPCLSESDLAVRLYDIDFNGHVSNIVYIRWLEDIRTIAFETIMPLKNCLDLGQTPVL